MEIAAIAMSGLSLLVAVVGTVLSNRRSSEALAQSRKASAAALWSGVQEAVQRLVGFDPTIEPIGERLANLRIACISLIDDSEEWVGLGPWLETERALGATLGRQVMESATPGDTVEERLNKLDPYQRWAAVLGQNLRHFRATGYDGNAAEKLRQNAASQTASIHQKHGWELPPTKFAGVEPLT